MSLFYVKLRVLIFVYMLDYIPNDFKYMNSYRSSYNHYGLFELEVFMFLCGDLLPIKQLFVFAASFLLSTVVTKNMPLKKSSL
jgi:hypothetical protein